MTPVTTWIVGASGLLGASLSQTAHARATTRLLDAPRIPWGDPARSAPAFALGARQLATTAEGGPWQIIWAAGSGVTSTAASVFAGELDELRAALIAIADELPAGARQRGSMFYASSAGALYAGSRRPPFDESTPIEPISDYGRFKAAAEGLVEEFSRSTGIAALNGRISNLYGPGQRMDKMQGLISHLARAQLSPHSASIFVPLETARDYLYVDDCSTLVLDAMDRLRAEADAGRLGEVPTVVKNLASGTGVTIASLLGYVRALTKRRPNVMIGRSSAAAMQAVDLRVHSVVWPEIDRRELTPLPAGIAATIADLRSSVQLTSSSVGSSRAS